MAAVFDTFIDELRALVVATWTDVPPNGVWELEDVKMVPWDDITPPMSTIIVPEMPLDETGEFGTCNDVHKGTISLVYVGETTGDGRTQRARAESMRDALLGASFTAAQVLSIASIGWSDTLDLNRTFLEKGYTQRAAEVRANVIVIANEVA